jgi:hypothetical protein
MQGFNRKMVEVMVGARLLYVTVCLCISISVSWFPSAVRAAVQRGPIPGIDENTPYCFFYGKWDDGVIEEVIQQGFKLVILHPGGNGVLNPGTNEVLITPEQVARLKQEGIITIGYIPIGEDYVGDREGDGTGPVYSDEENCQLVYQNQGVASWYLDEAPRDGAPDINTDWNSYFVNAGDPNWPEFIRTATIESDGFAGTEYILDTLGCDGLFLDTLETATPYNGGKYFYTWRGMFDLVESLSNDYPGKYMVGNRPLFACDTQWYPLTCCGSHPELCSQFCFCDFSSAAEARDRFRQNLNALVWESYSLDRQYDDFETTRGNVLTCADNTDGQGFSVMVLDYYNLIHGFYTCMNEQIEEVKGLGWLDYIAQGPLYQIGYWVINDCRNLSTPLIDGYFNDWRPWNAGWSQLDPDEAAVSKESTDIINIQLSHDTAYLYARIRCKGPIPEFDSNFYQIFLDTGADTAGYRGSSADWVAAYDFLWENGKLYRYTGSGSDWSWLEVNSTTCYQIGFLDESSMEIAIPLAVLDIDPLQGQTTRLLFAVNAFDVGQNDRAPQDPTQDAYVYEYKPLINIDGDFSDWENLPQCMFANYTDQQECICICPADILHVNVCSDANHMYFDMRFACDLPNPLWGGNFYQIFIDADQDPSTGYNLGSWAIGAEYLWENGKLYQYNGSGSDWSWALPNPTAYAVGESAGSRMEFAIPRSLIRILACQRYLSKDKPLRFIARVTNGVSSLDVTPNVPTSDFHQWPVPEEIIMDLPAGWSMISLPVVPEGLVLSDIFPEAVVVYGFERNVGYVRAQEDQALEAGKGYWILLNEARTYTFTGECIQEYPLSVEDGWHMIGGCTQPAQVVPYGCEIGVIYGFNQEVGYQRIPEPELLEPGRGYWILLNNAIPEATISVETGD